MVHWPAWDNGSVAVDGDRVLDVATLGVNRPGRGSASARRRASWCRRSLAVAGLRRQLAQVRPALGGRCRIQGHAVRTLSWTPTPPPSCCGSGSDSIPKASSQSVRLTEPRSCRTAADVPPTPIGGIRDGPEKPCDRAKSGIRPISQKVESMTLNFVVAKSVSLAHS